MLAGIDPGSQSRKLTAEAHAASSVDAAAEVGKQAGLADSYHFMQLLAGIVAVAFPVVLVGGHLALRCFDDPHPRIVEPSLSHYYYTRLGNFFVGALCALGLFFLSYQRKPLPGYEWDNRMTSFAGVMAFGVAMLPTAFDSHGVKGAEAHVFHLHLLCAMLLFAALGVVAWARFTLSGPVAPSAPGLAARLAQLGRAVARVLAFWRLDPYDAALPVRNKRVRNTIYRWSARVIFAVLVLLALNLPLHFFDGFANYLLVGEWICVWAFGLAWLVKAEAFGFLDD